MTVKSRHTKSEELICLILLETKKTKEETWDSERIASVETKLDPSVMIGLFR